MNMSDTRRDRYSTWTEYRRNVQVLSAILDNRHSPGGERFGQRGIDDDFGWGLLAAGERDNWEGLQLVPALCAAAVTADNATAAIKGRDVLPFRFIIFFFWWFMQLGLRPLE
jgi:hypothetical protein